MSSLTLPFHFSRACGAKRAGSVIFDGKNAGMVQKPWIRCFLKKILWEKQPKFSNAFDQNLFLFYITFNISFAAILLHVTPPSFPENGWKFYRRLLKDYTSYSLLDHLVTTGQPFTFRTILFNRCEGTCWHLRWSTFIFQQLPSTEYIAHSKFFFGSPNAIA